MIFQLLGGIGIFLLGMGLLTDGLKAFAGEALRGALMRFTGTPVKAFGSGALVTLLVQSSSATTVTLIGFVSAGLLAFPQAVGVVLGASLGTTGTGWLVAVLGLKVSLGFYALPLVGVGALLRLLGRARIKALGLALAGFGLIFIGIETLQAGMQGASGAFNLAGLPTSGFVGHVVTMVLGAAMTVVMQSSSAAVATTLTALHAGAVNFEQASALVIGAAIGTTVTGALAAIGGSVPAKRTALAHILFNLATGLIAVTLLPAFLYGITLAQTYLGLDPGATSLAAFHTAFIAVGIGLFLPFVDRFAAWIERMLPDRGPPLTRHLDDTLLQAPPVALEATRRALRDTASEVLGAMADIVAHRNAEQEDERRAQTRQALERIQHFFARIPPVNEGEPLARSRVSQVHAIDHLMRLQSRLHPSAELRRQLAHSRLQPPVQRVREAIDLAVRGLHGSAPADWLAILEESAASLATLREQERLDILHQTADGRWDPFAALEAMNAMRWLERVGFHAWRIANYLASEQPNESAPALAAHMDEHD